MVPWGFWLALIKVQLMVNIGVKKYVVSSLNVFVATSTTSYLDYLDYFYKFQHKKDKQDETYHAFFKVVVKQAFSKHARGKAFFKQG